MLQNPFSKNDASHSKVFLHMQSIKYRVRGIHRTRYYFLAKSSKSKVWQSCQTLSSHYHFPSHTEQGHHPGQCCKSRQYEENTIRRRGVSQIPWTKHGNCQCSIQAAAQTATAPASDGRASQAASFPASKKHTSCSMLPSAICCMLPSADRLCKGLSADFLCEFSMMGGSVRHPQFRRQGVNETPCTINFL